MQIDLVPWLDLRAQCRRSGVACKGGVRWTFCWAAPGWCSTSACWGPSWRATCACTPTQVRRLSLILCLRLVGSGLLAEIGRPSAAACSSLAWDALLACSQQAWLLCSHWERSVVHSNPKPSWSVLSRDAWRVFRLLAALLSCCLGCLTLAHGSMMLCGSCLRPSVVCGT